MVKHSIKNFEELSTTENRKMALEIIEAGLEAINTQNVISSNIVLKENILSVQGKNFDLNKYKRIKVIGFGKSSPDAALAIEKILGSRIDSGVIVGLYTVPCEHIESFVGTHPRPSEKNIEAGNKIFELLNGSTEEDLIIFLVSGGGSALLCYPESECTQGAKLYDAFLRAGKTISEVNTVSKHLSLLKGGGLVKLAYPATVVGLVFSDVPGDNFQDVASGATYKDVTTVEDVKKIIAENYLGDFDLIETPKEDKYFENVFNFVLVSNKTAVEAMAKKAEEYKLCVNIVSTELYDEVEKSLDKIFNKTGEGFSQVLGSPGPYPGQAMTKSFAGFVTLAAGEPSVVVPKDAGKGGRNLHMALESIKNNLVDDDSVFISFASDGMDNSDAAGAVVDKNTIEKINKLNIDVADSANRFDSYPVFEKSGDIIMTGPTGTNVSDLMLLLTKK